MSRKVLSSIEVDTENTHVYIPKKKETLSSGVPRKMFREVSNETSHAINGNGKQVQTTLKTVKKVARGKELVEKATNTSPEVEGENLVCDSCKKNVLPENNTNDMDDLEKLLTADDLDDHQTEQYWKWVCEETRECLKETLEEKEQLAGDLEKERRKSGSLELKLVLMEAKIEAMKEFVTSKLGLEEFEFLNEDEENL
ncbi:uncharacterized protein LOC134845718 [Symsagittifera roscoffensis]|uniref:uncharacterized protein LOC134845718 n=1 Tax=Symsagittifera roscoffensis TaxID=84072 RepID=UPI00307B2820